MYRRSPILLLLLAAYVFSPSLFDWLTDATSGWYKPFVVWLGIIVGAFFIQRRKLSPRES
jgi:hypothetical protein